jgi:hypothetical protein
MNSAANGRADEGSSPNETRDSLRSAHHQLDGSMDLPSLEVIDLKSMISLKIPLRSNR